MSPRHDPGERAVAEHIGRNLTRCREQAGLSVEQLSKRAELTRNAIRLIERGERLPQMDTFLKLEGGLGVHSSDLLRGIGWRGPEHSPGGAFYIEDRRAAD